MKLTHRGILLGMNSKYKSLAVNRSVCKTLRGSKIQAAE